jgi:CheY-like chemotaxis protein
VQLKVVAVDDEPDVLKAVSSLLQALECEVTAFADSREAAEHLETNKADGVFLDLSMPYLDGFELTRRIRSSELNSKVPIVMITGKSDADTMRKGFDAGVTVTTRKPVNLESLRKVVTVVRTAVLHERRQYLRVSFAAKVTCISKDKRLELTSLDISERGILLQGTTELQEGEELELSFHIPQQRQPMVVRGKVLRIVPPDSVGFAFINMSPTFRQSLMKYLLPRKR